jgi:hypothetical protein
MKAAEAPTGRGVTTITQRDTSEINFSGHCVNRTDRIMSCQREMHHISTHALNTLHSFYFRVFRIRYTVAMRVFNPLTFNLLSYWRNVNRKYAQPNSRLSFYWIRHRLWIRQRDFIKFNGTTYFLTGGHLHPIARNCRKRRLTMSEEREEKSTRMRYNPLVPIPQTLLASMFIISYKIYNKTYHITKSS